MPLTKLLKDTVKARVERDPAFRAALFQEALFFQVIHVIQKNEGINFQLDVLAKKKARVSQKVYA